MKIQRIQLAMLRVPLKTPFKTALRTVTAVEDVVVIVTTDTGHVLRGAAVLALLVWTVTTFAGTAPLNASVAEWDPTAPPADWRAVIGRWERMDTVRTVAATAAFALFLAAT